MADKKTVVYEIRIEEGQALQAFEALNLKQKENRDRLKEVNKEIADNVAITKRLAAEISAETGATAEQNAQLEALKNRRAELNRIQAESIVIDKGLSGQARELTNDLSGLTANNLRFRDKMADANLEAIKQSGILEALQTAAGQLQDELSGLNARYAQGLVSQEEFTATSERLSKAYNSIQGDIGAVKTRTEELTADTKKLKEIQQQLGEELQKLARDYASGAVSAEEYARRSEVVNQKLEETQKRVEETGKSVVSELGNKAISSLKDFAIGMGAAFAVDRLISFGNELRKEGIELEQLTSRAKVLFGLEGFEKLSADAKKNGEAIGVSKGEYIKLASSAQDVFTNLGFGKTQIAALSTEIVNNAGAIDDFTAGQVKAADAVKILSQAALGNTKGLKELNIPIKQGAEEVDALSASIQKSQGVTKEQGDALARLRFTFQALGPKIEEFKQFQSEADTAADKATAQFATAREELAERLTPAFTAATTALSNLINGFKAQLNTDPVVGSLERAAAGARLIGDTKQAEQLDKLVENLERVKERSDRLQSADGKRKATLEELTAELNTQAKIAKANKDLDTDGQKTAFAFATARFTALKAEIDRRKEVGTAAVASANTQNEADQTVEQRLASLTQKLDDVKKKRLELKATDTTGLGANDAEQARIQREIDAFDTKKALGEKSLKNEEDRAAKLSEINDKIAKDRADLDAKIADGRVDTSAKDAQEIQAIRDRYAKEIKEAEGFIAQQKQLQDLSDEEVLAKQNEQAARRVAALDAFTAQVEEADLRGKESALAAEESKWDAIIATTRNNAELAGDSRLEVDAKVAEVTAQRDRALLAQRVALIEEQAAAEKQAILEKYEGLYSTEAGAEAQNIELAKQAGTEIAAVDAELASNKVKLTVETNNAIVDSNSKRTEAEQASLQATGQSVASLLNTFQAFTDAGFDKDIADVSKQQASLQEQLNNATNEPEKQRIKERIEGLNKEKAALEERKKSEKGFAVAAALISTYLAAQQVFANPAFPDPITKAIAAAATIAAGLLNVAKLQGFSTSGRVRNQSGVLNEYHGSPIRRDNGDDLLVTAQVGEMFINEAHQRKAKQLYGDDIWRRIGIPGFASSGVVNEWSAQDIRRLSGYAGSGIVNDLFMPQPQPQAVTQVIQSQAIREQGDRPIIVDVREVTEVQDRVARINELARA